MRIRMGDSEWKDLRGLDTQRVRQKGRGADECRGENGKTVRMGTRGIRAGDGQTRNRGGQNGERGQRAPEEPRGGAEKDCGDENGRSGGGERGAEREPRARIEGLGGRWATRGGGGVESEEKAVKISQGARGSSRRRAEAPSTADAAQGQRRTGRDGTGRDGTAQVPRHPPTLTRRRSEPGAAPPSPAPARPPPPVAA